MSENSPFAPEEIRSRISATGLVPLLECGKVEPAEFIDRLSAALELRTPPQEFRNLWSSIFPSHTLIPESFIEALRKQYRILLLSNTNALHFEMILENYPILRHFDDYVLSYKVGAMKPDPLIYRAAIEKARCDAGECFFTDDIAAYVEAACNAGIDAVQFTGFDRLREEFSRRGVQAG
jgi:putative hydrolase of the HAD superfamily